MESRDRTDTVRLRAVTHLVCLHGSENQFSVFVCRGIAFVGGLEIHAWTTVRSPEIDDHSRVVINQFSEVSLRLNFNNFAEFRGIKSLWLLLLLTTHSWHSAKAAAPTELLHHLLHHLWVHSTHTRHAAHSWHLGRLLLGGLLGLGSLVFNIFLENGVASLH